MTLSYKDVADIIKIIDASSCDEIIIELAGSKIVVRRGGRGADMPSAPSVSTGSQSAITPAAQKAALPPAGKTTDVQPPSGDKSIMRSPMVGTFYRGPSPKDPPFVDVGSIVKIGDPLCIIEVMKLFTTITAERAGKVASIFPGNAELVEFDQPLFQIEPV